MVHELLGDCLAARAVAVYRHGDRRADIADVGSAEPGADADRERLACCLQCFAAGDQLGHRPLLGAAAVEPVEHRPPRNDGLRAHLALHRAFEQMGALPGAFVLVDMRIGAEGNQGAGIVGHGLRHVGVQVERHDDRHVGPEPSAQARQQLALAILVGVDDHRAMQVQQDAVDRTLTLDRREDHAADLLEGVIGHGARRIGVGRDRVDQRPTVFVGRLEGRAQGRAGAAERRRDLIVTVEVAAPPQRHVGLLHAEGVGLVHEPAGQNALHRCPLTKRVPSRRGGGRSRRAACRSLGRGG